MTTKLARRTFLKATAAAAFAACAPSVPSAASPGASASAASKALVPFKWLFGFTISAGADLPVVIAKELGYYKQQGLDFSWDFTTDSTGIRLIGTGQYQAGSVSDAAAPVNFINQGIPLKIISLMTQRGARALAVKKGSGITRPKDFEGKKVGIKTSPWTEYLVMLASETPVADHAYRVARDERSRVRGALNDLQAALGRLILEREAPALSGRMA